MKNILVLIDGSAPSLRALEQAFELAQQKGPVTLHVVNVQIPITPSRAARFFSQEVLDDYYSEEGQQALEKAASLLEQSPAPIKKQVVVGRLEEAVPEYIDTHQCTHVVMGTRGLSALPGMVLGSVTSKIIQAVDVPITLVK